ncbi:MAG: cytochrome c, partial [Gammaproteobacteria bacterium]|nr:cytochrome c [Gammaproteobacteria bacterium]
MRWTKILQRYDLAVVMTMSVHAWAGPDISLEAQADAGKRQYDRVCVDCHRPSLRGSAHGPELAGKEFLGIWGSRSTGDLFLRIKNTMPPGGNADLADADYLNLVAYILQANAGGAGPAA